MLFRSDDSVGTGTTGMNPGNAAIVKMMGELSDELRRSIDFYLNQSEELEIVQLLLAGPGAAIGDADQFFNSRLNIPTSRVDPVDALGIEGDDAITYSQRPGFGVVLGLGLRETLDEKAG